MRSCPPVLLFLGLWENLTRVRRAGASATAARDRGRRCAARARAQRSRSSKRGKELLVTSSLTRWPGRNTLLVATRSISQLVGPVRLDRGRALEAVAVAHAQHALGQDPASALRVDVAELADEVGVSAPRWRRTARAAAGRSPRAAARAAPSCSRARRRAPPTGAGRAARRSAASACRASTLGRRSWALGRPGRRRYSSGCFVARRLAREHAVRAAGASARPASRASGQRPRRASGSRP